MGWAEGEAPSVSQFYAAIYLNPSNSSLASLWSDGEGKAKGCGFYERGWCFVQLS